MRSTSEEEVSYTNHPRGGWKLVSQARLSRGEKRVWSNSHQTFVIAVTGILSMLCCILRHNWGLCFETEGLPLKGRALQVKKAAARLHLSLSQLRVASIQVIQQLSKGVPGPIASHACFCWCFWKQIPAQPYTVPKRSRYCTFPGLHPIYCRLQYSLVTSPRAPPGEKRSGERSRISWAYSPKR